jgi:hypothetical protein
MTPDPAREKRARKRIVDPRSLGVGALVAGGAGLAGLIGALGHHVIAGAGGGTEQSIEAVFFELLIVLGVLGIGLPAATFVAVWRGARAVAGTQGLAAIASGWVAGFGPGALAVALLPGGSTETLEAVVPLSPVYVAAQVLAAVAAGIANRVRAARRAR